MYASIRYAFCLGRGELVEGRLRRERRTRTWRMSMLTGKYAVVLKAVTELGRERDKVHARLVKATIYDL